MKRKIIKIAVIALLMTGSASAFDHDRRGFVFGAGVGFSPSASWETDPYYLPGNADHAGFAAHVVVGSCKNSHDVIAGEWNAALYSSQTDLTPSKSVSVLQWQLAASWYHYYGRSGRPLFTVLGFGPYFLTPAWNELTEFGGALLLGGGYEFARHMQIGVYYTFGRVFSLGPKAEGCGHLSVLLTVIEY